jgi:uncharacterized protein (TIGR03067 family)
MRGRLRSPTETNQLANLVLVAEPDLPGWHGVWGLVVFDSSGGQRCETSLSEYCREMVFHGTWMKQSVMPHIFMLAGGKFRVAANAIPATIDLQQHWGGQDLPSLNLGIYRLEGEHLYLCQGGPGNPRPMTFDGSQNDQSYGQLKRFCS